MRWKIEENNEHSKDLLLPSSHPPAGKESVTAGEPLAAYAGMAALWTGFCRLDPRPDGDPAPLGPMIVDKLEAAVGGRAVALVPADDPRGTLRDDLVTVPLTESSLARWSSPRAPTTTTRSSPTTWSPRRIFSSATLTRSLRSSAWLRDVSSYWCT